MNKVTKKKTTKEEEIVECTPEESAPKPYRKKMDQKRLITAEGWKRMMMKSAKKGKAK
jgi:hypothetical protein